MATILAVDDEQPILELIKNGLQKDGHMVVGYTSAEQVPLNKLNRYDLIILDIMMPGIDGFSFCEKIRDLVDCPILFLTAKTMENDITFGLGLGADDYLTKPFRIPELRARVTAHIRREQREHHSCLTFDHIKFDLSAKTVQVDGKIVSLTKSEYMICEFLARNKGQVFTREQIYEAVFSFDGESDDCLMGFCQRLSLTVAFFDVSFTVHDIPLLTAACIGVARQQRHHIPAGLDQDFLNLVRLDDFRFRYGIGKRFPKICDIHLVAGLQIGNVTEVGRTAPASMPSDDAVGIVSPYGEAGLAQMRRASRHVVIVSSKV